MSLSNNGSQEQQHFDYDNYSTSKPPEPSAVEPPDAEMGPPVETPAVQTEA